MTAPRMTDEECVLLLNDLATSTMADDDMDDVRAEMLRARSSESALLARVERLEGALRRFATEQWHETLSGRSAEYASVADPLVLVFGCQACSARGPSVDALGHDSGCPIRAALSEPT